MARVSPALGGGLVVEVNSTTLKSTTYRRERRAGEIELATSGLEPDADLNYELPHDAGFIKTTIRISAPIDIGAMFHDAPYNIRAGTYVDARFGQTATLLTPESTYVVMETTDENEASMTGIGRWEAVLMPYDDAPSPGYYTEAS